MKKRNRNVVPKTVTIDGVVLSDEQRQCMTDAAAFDYWAGMPDESVGAFLKREISESDPLQKTFLKLKIRLEAMKDYASFVIETLRKLGFKLMGDFFSLSVRDLSAALMSFWVLYKQKIC